MNVVILFQFAILYLHGIMGFYYENGSFPDKAGQLEHMSRRVVSKKGHPDTYATTKSIWQRPYIKLLQKNESLSSTSLFKKLEALETYSPVRLRLNLNCNSVFIKIANEFT